MNARPRPALRSVAALVVGLVLLVTAAPAGSVEGRSITYVGVMYDQTDFVKLNIGRAGYWFPQFAAAEPVEGRPTGENARDALPSWAGPLNHATSTDPTFVTRTFSQDGPARSKGGQPSWNTFKLPSGEVGLSGAIVDPHARCNTNNTINRIQLGDGVPSTFYFHVVTDNTAFEHDPVRRLRARGNVGLLDLDSRQVDPDRFPPQTGDMTYDGVADVYTFRFDGFRSGDFIKLQLSGDDAPGGASFAGFLFDDDTFDPAKRSRRGPRDEPVRPAHPCP